MWRTLRSLARFVWTAAAGTRLRPWRSAYLRWRFETYTGKPAASVGLNDFVRLALTERRQLHRFSRWMGEIGHLARERDEG